MGHKVSRALEPLVAENAVTHHLKHSRLAADSELTMAVSFEQDQRMTFVPALGRLFLVSVCAFCATKAIGDDSLQSRPLIQADFSRLVPRSYPLVTTRFNALKPTAYPALPPGNPAVQITEKLVRPINQPLLRTNTN